MPCDVQYGMGNKPTGTVICHSRGRRSRPPPPCAFCRRRPGHLLCDGPGQRPKSTCDKPICNTCSTQLRAIDRDFCPDHGPDAPAEDLGCALSDVVPCGGAFVKAHDLCVRHAVLFDHWAGHCGGLEVYRDPALNREQKRTRFRTWLINLTSSQVTEVFRLRRAV